MDSSQRTAIQIEIGYNFTELTKFLGVADNLDVLSDRRSLHQDMRDQRVASEFHEGLIPAHAGTLSADEDESGDGLHRLMISLGLFATYPGHSRSC